MILYNFISYIKYSFHIHLFCYFPWYFIPQMLNVNGSLWSVWSLHKENITNIDFSHVFIIIQIFIIIFRFLHHSYYHYSCELTISFYTYCWISCHQLNNSSESYLTSRLYTTRIICIMIFFVLMFNYL